jgi:hypothetical protein
MNSRTTFFTHSASIFEESQINWEYSMEVPTVVETNTSAQTQSRPSSPSITSGITGTSPSTVAPGGLSYASVAARQTLDPEILALKEQLAKLQTNMQEQQQRLQQTSAPPTSNPPSAVILPTDFAEIIQEMMATMHQQQLQLISSIRTEIAELRNQYQPLSTPSPARKKVCSNALTSESHLSEASLSAREDDDASMDHVS